MNISIFANVSSLQFLGVFPTQESIEQNKRLLPHLCQPIQTHAMAVHHGGTGKSLEKDSNPQENDVAIHDEYQEDINDFENIEPDHHERLRDLTLDIDHL